jgi:hypothetical protein
MGIPVAFASRLRHSGSLWETTAASRRLGLSITRQEAARVCSIRISSAMLMREEKSANAQFFDANQIIS